MRWLLAIAALGLAIPAAASTFASVAKVCPVGGEKFTASELASISTWGGLPDGMPLGSGQFPVELTQCPKNGLVLFRDFKPEDVARLTPLIADPAYQALRKTETRYYLAYWLATRMNDEEAPWLLLSATWQAKNAGAGSALARRYNEEFVALVARLPTSDADLLSIALRGRAANALRELGRFDEAQALRESIAIADTAGGKDENAAANRKGWKEYLDTLATIIARRDSDRSPIDYGNKRDAALRCLRPEREKVEGLAVTPLSDFETTFCARADVTPEIDKWRMTLKP